jgi:SAM-dependent methyltransferase
MGAYESFARVYDLFMDNVPYEEWGSYLTGLLREYGICSGTVAELGCGTGKMTRLLAAAGYDMIGVDNSEEMLEIAREAEYEADAWSAAEAWDEADETDELEEYAELGQPDEPEESDESDEPDEPDEPDESDEPADRGILYLLEDMRELELYGSVRAVVSVCDSMNYILEEADLREVFSRVHEYLEEDGVFIFDLNTVYKYRDLLGETTIAENREEGSFIWENYFDEESAVNEYDLTLYIREDGESYRRFEEVHYQRAYDLKTIDRLLADAGMELTAAYDAFTKEPVRDDSERIYVVARPRR